MKKLQFIAAVLLCCAGVMIACHGTPGAVAKWKVSPNTNVSMNRSYSFDHKNTITFKEAGTYVVSAEIRKVWCSEVTAANPGMDT